MTELILNFGIELEFYVGTVEVMARVVPLGTESIKPGESGFVQLRLEEEIAVKNYDKFIIRTYSPMITIGGRSKYWTAILKNITGSMMKS